MEIRPKTAVHRQPPPRRLAQFSRRVGRGCWQVFGLAGMADQSDRFFYWPIFPVSEKTSAHWVFGPAYRCGGSPGFAPGSLWTLPWERHQQTNHKIEGRSLDVNPIENRFGPRRWTLIGTKIASQNGSVLCTNLTVRSLGIRTYVLQFQTVARFVCRRAVCRGESRDSTRHLLAPSFLAAVRRSPFPDHCADSRPAAVVFQPW